MRLTLDGAPVAFVALDDFRRRWGLPPEFGVAHFEPKDWQGLGSMDHARPGLARVRELVVGGVPEAVHLPDLPQVVDALSDLFRRELEAANPQIGLRTAEVDFAVAGFYAIVQATADHLARLSHAHRTDPRAVLTHFDFPAVYAAWLDGSARVAGHTHVYERAGARFDVRVVYYAYGRLGLEVTVEGETYYVADTSLACPAAGYMQSLCADVGAALCQALAGARG